MLYEVILWLRYGFLMAAAIAVASAGREVVFWPLCQPGENKHVCSSYSSSQLTPACVLSNLGSANSETPPKYLHP